MMARFRSATCLALFAFSSAAGQQLRSSGHESENLFHIHAKAIKASRSEDKISVSGNSNLPAGARLIIWIGDFVEGSNTLNDETVAVVSATGRFKAFVRPRRNVHFRPKLHCLILFEPNYPAQPKDVVITVGRHGEHLGF